MARTQRRPLPAHEVDAAPGTRVRLVLAVSLRVLARRQPARGVAGAARDPFYVFVYTLWLKRTTPQNIVIGGAAGALPPVIGWAAVTGNSRCRR